MNGKQIAIVDDSSMILSRLKTLLEDVPGILSIHTAGNYADALALLATTRPDIILLDINLPDGNGIDLLRYLRKEYPDIIPIMISNQASSFYRNLCMRIGAAHFIDKSTEFELIPGILANFL